MTAVASRATFEQQRKGISTLIIYADISKPGLITTPVVHASLNWAFVDEEPH